MPEPTLPTPSRAVEQPLALGVGVYGEAVTTVAVTDIGDAVVSLRIGDDRQAVQLFGPVEVIRQVIVQCAAELGRPRGQRDNR